jgi:hypothetical protein
VFQQPAERLMADNIFQPEVVDRRRWLEKEFEIPMPKEFTADPTRILTDGLADDLADKVVSRLTDTNTQPHASTDIPKID